MKQCQIDRIRQNYPIGTRLELTSPMSGENGMPAGLKGTVTYVDDIGSYG